MATQINPLEVDSVEKAVNEASSRASGLWLSFVTFTAYLAVTAGSVTHRMLFLETPIRLPLLNVDLPLVSFFVVAPFLLVIFHFYLIQQFIILAKKIRTYNDVLSTVVGVKADRVLVRHRLDSFLIVQYLAGPEVERQGVGAGMLRYLASVPMRAIVSITFAVAPVIVFLLIQVSFLPYHDETITWLHRLLILFDVAVVIWGWVAIRMRVDSWAVTTIGMRFIAYGLFALPVCVFSIFMATHPGETMDRNFVAQAVDGVLRLPAPGGELYPASEALFRAPINEVSGNLRSWFSNILVLADQKFVDEEKVDKVDRTVSLRGRDLRGAIFIRADMRKADFTGANLSRARLDRARLNRARFDCAETGLAGAQAMRQQWPTDGCAWLDRASFEGAQLNGASFIKAHLRGAVFDKAQLHGAVFRQAWLQGASLLAAELHGAELRLAKLQGANLKDAKLHAASFENADLTGAALSNAEMQGSILDLADLRGATLKWAQLQGGSLTAARLQGAALDWASVWCVRGRPISFVLMTVVEINTTDRPFEGSFESWRWKITYETSNAAARTTVDRRLSALDPDECMSSPLVLPDRIWAEQSGRQPRGGAFHARLADFLIQLGCEGENAPYIAHRLIWNGRISDTGSHVGRIAAAFKDRQKCHGFAGLDPKDIEQLENLAKVSP